MIINECSMPSRMTISMLLEMLTGKLCALEGELGDATPFTESSTDIHKTLETALTKHGYENYGWETMYNGTTGKMFQTKIFIGISYYQKLKHMVSDKMHARSYGNITTLTRQPLAGRSKEGGLRIGEMERDGILSHGSVQFLKERLFDMSDAFEILICKHCQIISNHKDICHQCGASDLAWTNMPYAGKLLFQQLNACLIGTKFKVETQ
jgi:DNA-directed RNA polymerase II subunit RPB2